MNKLYWIVCEDKDVTLFEGRFQGRTRGAAIKFLKTSIDRSSLKGLIFTISEIPVHLIREIVAEMLGIPLDSIGVGNLPAASVETINVSSKLPRIDSDGQLTAGSGKASPTNGITAVRSPIDSKRRGKSMSKVGNPGHGEEFWTEVHAFWKKCRSTKETAIKFKLSQNSVKTRACRDDWRTEVPTP